MAIHSCAVHAAYVGLSIPALAAAIVAALVLWWGMFAGR